MLPRTLLLLASEDLSNRPRLARTYLFLLPFGLFWFWLLRAMAGGVALWLEQPEGRVFAAWLLNPVVAEGLFAGHPGGMALFFMVALGTLPGFVMLAAFDQTSSDTGRGYLRFLAFRSSRMEIYLARMLGAWITVFLAYVVVWMGAVVVTVALGGGTDFIPYSLRVLFTLAIYAAPFVALLAAISASIASGPLAGLAAAAGYAFLLAALHFMAVQLPQLHVLYYLLPSAFKTTLLAGNPGDALLAALLMPLYTLAYAGFGWWVFKDRDL